MSHTPPQATINTAPAHLNMNDKAMWALGWNECIQATRTKPALVLDNPWRSRLLDGRKLERDAEGFVMHPDFPATDEDTNNVLLFAALGIELRATEAEDDLSYEDFELSMDQNTWHNWTPNPPQGDDWVLVNTFDSENGPVALWMREAPVNYASTSIKWIEHARKALDLPCNTTMYELITRIQMTATRARLVDAELWRTNEISEKLGLPKGCRSMPLILARIDQLMGNQAQATPASPNEAGQANSDAGEPA